MTTGAQVVAEARTHLGKRWTHQGRGPTLDCIGLIVVTAHGLDLSRFDVSDYSPIAVDETLLKGCREHLVEVPRASMAPGDVVVIRSNGNQRHIAILGDYPAGGLSLIHSSALSPRKVVEVRLDSRWRAAIMAAFRFPQVHAQLEYERTGYIPPPTHPSGFIGMPQLGFMLGATEGDQLCN